MVAYLGRLLDRVCILCATEDCDRELSEVGPGGGARQGWVDRIADFCRARIPNAVVTWCTADDGEDDTGH